MSNSNYIGPCALQQDFREVHLDSQKLLTLGGKLERNVRIFVHVYAYKTFQLHQYFKSKSRTGANIEKLFH